MCAEAFRINLHYFKLSVVLISVHCFNKDGADILLQTENQNLYSWLDLLTQNIVYPNTVFNFQF